MRSCPWTVWTIAILAAALHLWPGGGYGWFRDELYYLACAARPALGYVDHPPLAPLVLGLQTRLCGDAVWTLRILPALAHAGLVLVAAATARRLGGGRLAQAIAGVAVASGLVYLVVFDFFSMNCFEVLLWAAILHLVVVRVLDDRPRLWLGIGILTGVAAETKHTIVLLAAALAVCTLTTRLRSDLRSRWLWLGAACALLLALPNLLWQFANGFPSLEFYRNAQAGKNVDTAPWAVLGMQVLVVGPLAAAVCLPGLLALMRGRWPGLRSLAWVWVLLVGLMIAAGSSRPDRIAGVYPLLLAAGGVAVERSTASRRWLGRLALALVAAGGLFLLPLGLAAAPRALTLRYAEAAGSTMQIERGRALSLPQWLGDRLGWPELAALVARARDALPEHERGNARVLASNYGQAGAIERFGRDLGLPPVACRHNSWHAWSRDLLDAPVWIAVGFGRQGLDRLFAEVVPFDRLDAPLAIEHGCGVHVCRSPRRPLAEVWDDLRSWQ